MNRVKMVNLDREYSEIGTQIDSAIKEVLNSSRLSAVLFAKNLRQSSPRSANVNIVS